MKGRTYKVREMFRTLQGEGAHAGRPAVFCRFAGCNLWSGRDETRDADAERNGAECPRFCDTDFVGGTNYTATQLVQELLALGAGPDVFVVLTGGEPLLQVDAELLVAMQDAEIHAHVETNGTVLPTPGVLAKLHWITVSPKVDASRLKLSMTNEIKVVYPSYNPEQYLDVYPFASHFFVQPEDGPNAARNLQACMVFVQTHAPWRLGVQLHKIIGVP